MFRWFRLIEPWRIHARPENCETRPPERHHFLLARFLRWVFGKLSEHGGSSWKQVLIGDLAIQSDLDAATRSVDSIIHCASKPTQASQDIEGTRSLLESAGRNGVRRFVYISIVGVDRPSAPYYQTKYEVEKLSRTPTYLP